ncbi:MAG TPA: Smr/MutS family protein [Anaeromyxobacteraceae bacterium]|nr:Smr/MutS family protein [Anaeromyxobacteraceae bacterium]
MAEKKKPFHNPFGKLRDMRPAAKAPPPPPAAPPPRRAPDPSDEELWAQATAGARPVAERDKVVAGRTPRPGPAEFWHPDLDALRALESLVSGDAPFDIADSDEFIEGTVSGLDPQVVRKLRRGEFSVQGHLDLHGLSRGEARAAVEAFLRESRQKGKRCVLLVHGRGLHSRDQVPVLKEALRSWLATARFGRHVLAFATARPQDGGAGAVYVLLRRLGR